MDRYHLSRPELRWLGSSSPRVSPFKQVNCSCSTSAVKAPQAPSTHVTLTHKPRLSYVGIIEARASSSSSQACVADGMTRQIDWSEYEDQLKLPQITRSDQQFLKQNLEFVWGAEGLNLTELNDLFEKVGFPSRDLHKLQLALDNTHAVLWIRSTRASRWAKLGQLLGFARAFSDKALTATIWDVAVHPAWQRGGLGRGLIERLTASLIEDDIQTICLYAEPGVIKMYEKLGFVVDPYGVKGMAFQRKSQKGKALLAPRG